MKALIQRYSQQQIGRFLAIALLPFLAAGTVGLVASAYFLFPLFITVPLYAAGMYLYVGYVRTGWYRLSVDKSRKTWTRSIYYNGLLVFATILSTGGIIIDSMNSLADLDRLVAPVVLILGQALVGIVTYYARDLQHTEMQELETKISEIGA